MPELSDPLRAALGRLTAALDRLDALSLRSSEQSLHRKMLETELSLMREDRHSLTQMLDEERSAKRIAEGSLHEMAPRIERAIGVVRACLAEV